MKKKPFLSKKIDKGPFKGKTLVVETAGVTKRVLCKECGYSAKVTFFLKDFKVSDAGSCPDCSSKLLTFVEGGETNGTKYKS